MRRAAVLAGAALVGGIFYGPALTLNAQPAESPPRTESAPPEAVPPEAPGPAPQALIPSDPTPKLPLQPTDGSPAPSSAAPAPSLPSPAPKPQSILWRGLSPRSLTGLLASTPAPGASRWLHRQVAATLIASSSPPPGMLEGDFAAARARLLLRMGNSVAAKRVVNTVPLAHYSRKLYAAAAFTHLATGDVPALCPIASTGEQLYTDPLWRLTNAVCAGLQGDEIGAAVLLDALRSGNKVSRLDIDLADRLATLMVGGERGVNATFASTDALTSYRFGLALASGTPLPRTPLVPALRGWLASAPGASLEQRLDAGRLAVATGMISPQEWRQLWAQHAATLSAEQAAADLVGWVRQAHAANLPAGKIAALNALWATAQTETDLTALRLLGAGAAATLIPDASPFVAHAPAMARALLLDGKVKESAKWWHLARQASKRNDRKGTTALLTLWPLQAAAQGGRGFPVSRTLFDLWERQNAQQGTPAQADRRAALVAAALAGLNAGRDFAPGQTSVDFPPLKTLAARKLQQAATARHPAATLLWATKVLGPRVDQVSPGALVAVLQGLRQAGFSALAQSVAVEILIRNGV